MLGADPMMGVDQPGFDIAEKGVDDREKFAGIGKRERMSGYMGCRWRPVACPDSALMREPMKETRAAPR